MSSLTGKVAIVTGASGGIGHAIAERLAQEGAAVVVNYGKSADKAKAVVTEIDSKGGKAIAMQADMSRVADDRRLVRDTVQRFGRLDILVNNAGISLNKPLIETTALEWAGSPPFAGPRELRVLDRLTETRAIRSQPLRAGLVSQILV